jgi:deoxyribonuclease V
MRKLHDWDLSYAEARQLQVRLARRVRLVPLAKEPEFVGGLDCAFSGDGKRVFAAAIVLKVVGSHLTRQSVPCFDLELVETASAQKETRFPYVPGLLSFREAPACLEAIEKLKQQPDLFLVDGQGIAHPRRLGLASHLGLWLRKPTMGCAKSRLIGAFEPPAPERGAYSRLWDKDETIGMVVRTRRGVKSLFVSPGHLCTLDDAVRVTVACAPRYRVPEPTRLAHQVVTKLRMA